MSLAEKLFRRSFQSLAPQLRTLAVGSSHASIGRSLTAPSLSDAASDLPPFRCYACHFTASTREELSAHLQSAKHVSTVRMLRGRGLAGGKITYAEAITGRGDAAATSLLDGVPQQLPDLLADEEVGFVIPSAKDVKIAQLESAIRDQDQKLSELRQELDLVQARVVTPDKEEAWRSTLSISVAESVIERSGRIDGKNYVFRNEEFKLGSQIVFQVTGMDCNFMESLSFGVTVFTPQVVDLDSLPGFGLKLFADTTSLKWFGSNDVLSDPKPDQVVSITRFRDGVYAKTLASVDKLFDLDPYVRVYPFFLMDGCVSRINLKDFTAQERKQSECIVCLKSAATHFATSCRHLLYCGDCMDGVRVSSLDNKCQMCESDVTDYAMIRIK